MIEDHGESNREDHAQQRRGLSRWCDILLVLTVATTQPYISTVGWYMHDPSAYEDGNPLWDTISLFGYWLPTLAVLVYLVWSRGDAWERFGLKKFRFSTDVLLTVITGLFWVGMIYTSMWLFYFLGVWRLDEAFGFYDEQFADSFGEDPSAGHWVLLVLAHAVNALAEEWVFRSYVLVRMIDEGIKPVRAVVYSSLVFASYHTYQGLGSTIDIFLGACVMCAIFLIFRRLWPLVIVHALWNLWIVQSYGI